MDREIEQLEEIRRTGRINILNDLNVLAIAEKMGYEDLIVMLDEGDTTDSADIPAEK